MCRCNNERLKAQTDEFTRLTYTGSRLRGTLKHLKIGTRLSGEMPRFESMKGETSMQSRSYRCVISRSSIFRLIPGPLSSAADLAKILQTLDLRGEENATTKKRKTHYCILFWILPQAWPHLQWRPRPLAVGLVVVILVVVLHGQDLLPPQERSVLFL